MQRCVAIGLKTYQSEPRIGDNLLVSDANGAYRKVSQNAGIAYHSANLSQNRRVDGARSTSRTSTPATTA